MAQHEPTNRDLTFMTKSLRPIATAGLLTALLCGAASASTLSITIENTTGAGGFSITPLYTAFHDENFDAFNVGEAATPGVEQIAETGAAATVAAERLALDPDSQGNVNPSPSGPPPIQPGESVTVELDIDGASNPFFTFLAMLLPTNDTFIGMDDPLRLFADDGTFLGPQVIEVTGEHIYDAGTEVNGLEGSAFVAGQDITLGEEENGVITRAGADIANIFAGAPLAAGGNLGSGDVLDFFSSPQDFRLLTISISEVSQVPLPASAPLLAAALGFMGWRARKAKRSSES
jgi:hypothetical protein